MNTYKLVKKYPSLPKDWEIGMEIGLGDRNYSYSPCSGKYTDFRKLDNSEVENYPEFWQKMVQKDYEILSLKQKDCNILYEKPFKIFSNALICFENGFSSLEIHSIKRLSDGEIFTIGDACHLNNGNYYKSELKEFKFFTNGEHGHLEKHRNNTFLKVGIQSCHSDKPTFFYLESIVKAKEVLFKTEDGVGIYVNQYSYGVHLPTMKFTGDYIWRYKEHFSSSSLSKDVKYFSTEEKAKEYILMNKSCLSINDVLQNIRCISKTLDEKGLKDFVKLKL